MSPASADNVNGNINDNVNGNDIIFTIKDTKLYVPVVSLSATDNQKLSRFLSKGFERPVYWNEYKTKSENSIGFFLNQFFLELTKRFKTRKDYLPKGIINNDNVINNGKIFYNQPIDSDIKLYEEIRKLTTGQGEYCNTGVIL